MNISKPYSKPLINGESKTTDIVVVGGGLAGLKSAVTAAKSGLNVTLVVKSRLCSGASFYPMMDQVACQSATGIPEEDAAYLDEIAEASLGMANLEMNRVYIQTIRQRVAEFPEIGVDNYRITEPKIACFAKTARPTYVWSNWEHIRENARAILGGMENVTLLEQTSVISLLTTADKAICGVILMTDGELSVLRCKSVILATGGYGNLYEQNLNTADVSGDGQALALMAGASLINLEFIQFIPGFISPAHKTVFRETSIPYIASFLTDDGRDPLAELLPNAADREECLKIRAGYGPFTCRLPGYWFDLAMAKEILNAPDQSASLRLRYKPEILSDERTFLKPYVTWLREKKNVDLSRDEIRIAPFYHAANGGIKIDARCESDVKGLFACGEVSGGIHGADRLGGQSTGSCLVFGYIAGRSAAEHAAGSELRAASNPEDVLRANYAGNPNDNGLTPQEIPPIIRREMYRKANILREEKTLQSALDRISEVSESIDPLRWIATESAADAIKTAHMSALGKAVLRAMLWRRESRGSHFRQDYPAMNPDYNQRFELKMD